MYVALLRTRHEMRRATQIEERQFEAVISARGRYTPCLQLLLSTLAYSLIVFNRIYNIMS